jgi:hypothetical protein
MSQDRYSQYDPSSTGTADTNSNATWWNLRKKPTDYGFVRMKDKVEVDRTNSLTGYLAPGGFDLRKRDAVPEKKIPLHYEITLTLDIFDEPTQEWGAHKVSVASMSQEALSNLLNTLCATDVMTWDRWIKLTLYIPKANPNSVRLSVRVSKDDPQPAMFEWNKETNKGYIGVPSPIFIDTPTGKIGDWRHVEKFWLNYAMLFYTRFTGHTYSGTAIDYFDIPVNAQAQDIAMSIPAGAPTPTPSPTPTSNAPAGLPEFALPTDDTKAVNFWKNAQKYLSKTDVMSLADGLKTSLEHQKQHGNYVSTERILDAFTQKLRNMPGYARHSFTEEAKLAEVPPPVNTNITANHDIPDDGDLPF